MGLMAQGLQRGLDAAGRVHALTQPSALLADALGPDTLVFLSGERGDQGSLHWVLQAAGMQAAHARGGCWLGACVGWRGLFATAVTPSRRP